MSPEINCIKDCHAICCKVRVFFNLFPHEAEWQRRTGNQIKLTNGIKRFDGRYEYEREGGCSSEEDDLCIVYSAQNGEERGERLVICREFEPGSKECLKFRAENPGLVKNLTEKDRKFQNWWFGLDESA